MITAGKVKEGIEDKARDIRSRLMYEAQAQFVTKVQKWEKCSWDEAVALCSGTGPERHPEYILGYRMSDPLLLQAMYMSLSRKGRETAKANFRETLDPDCQKLFDENGRSIGDAFIKEYRTKKGRS